jgi:hypothetical protein
MAQYPDRYVPADTNGGWGFASFVVALAVACIVTVTYIHKQTYRHPTDPTWHGKGSGDAAPAGAGSLGH